MCGPWGNQSTNHIPQEVRLGLILEIFLISTCNYLTWDYTISWEVLGVHWCHALITKHDRNIWQWQVGEKIPKTNIKSKNLEINIDFQTLDMTKCIKKNSSNWRQHTCLKDKNKDMWSTIRKKIQSIL
jgi:hypothetical protein